MLNKKGLLNPSHPTVQSLSANRSPPQSRRPSLRHRATSLTTEPESPSPDRCERHSATKDRLTQPRTCLQDMHARTKAAACRARPSQPTRPSGNIGSGHHWSDGAWIRERNRWGAYIARKIGGGGWTRTTDIGLMRPPLCQLSYAAMRTESCGVLNRSNCQPA